MSLPSHSDSTVPLNIAATDTSRYKPHFATKPSSGCSTNRTLDSCCPKAPAGQNLCCMSTLLAKETHWQLETFFRLSCFETRSRGECGDASKAAHCHYSRLGRTIPTNVGGGNVNCIPFFCLRPCMCIPQASAHSPQNWTRRRSSQSPPSICNFETEKANDCKRTRSDAARRRSE